MGSYRVMASKKKLITYTGPEGTFTVTFSLAKKGGKKPTEAAWDDKSHEYFARLKGAIPEKPVKLTYKQIAVLLALKFPGRAFTDSSCSSKWQKTLKEVYENVKEDAADTEEENDDTEANDEEETEEDDLTALKEQLDTYKMLVEQIKEAIQKAPQ